MQRVEDAFLGGQQSCGGVLAFVGVDGGRVGVEPDTVGGEVSTSRPMVSGVEVSIQHANWAVTWVRDHHARDGRGAGTRKRRVTRHFAWSLTWSG